MSLTIGSGGATRRQNLGSLGGSPSDPSRNVDWLLMLATTALATLGVVAIYSASKANQLYKGLDVWFYPQRQVIFLIAGTALMALVMSVDYGWIKEHSGALYLGTILALLGTLIIGTGPPGSGAHAWFDVGPLPGAPSPLAKVSGLVLVAGYPSAEPSAQLGCPRFAAGR